NLAKTSKPTIEITLDGDEYTIKTITTLKTTEIKFKLGEEFEENRMDGVKVKVSCLCLFFTRVFWSVSVRLNRSPRKFNSRAFQNQLSRQNRVISSRDSCA